MQELLYNQGSEISTIWLCLNDIPKHLQNTVINYRMLVDGVYGISKKDAPATDFMEMVVIRLGGGMDEENAPEVIKYLYGIKLIG